MGADFSQFEERGATDTGRILATNDEEIRKPAPSLRVAAKIRACFVVALGSGAATAFGLRLACPDFRTQRLHPNSVNRPLSLTGPGAARLGW